MDSPILFCCVKLINGLGGCHGPSYLLKFCNTTTQKATHVAQASSLLHTQQHVTRASCRPGLLKVRPGPGRLGSQANPNLAGRVDPGRNRRFQQAGPGGGMQRGIVCRFHFQFSSAVACHGSARGSLYMPAMHNTIAIMYDRSIEPFRNPNCLRVVMKQLDKSNRT